MVELLWILLPIAAASGWYVARRSDASAGDDSEPVPSFGANYYQGLNYLLNEQPDKAIEIFLEVIAVDSETVETHVALGNLFRRRGEVERAIRIHQNLIARSNLSTEQRAQALLELGQDYMKAGLFDRAERLFLELIEMKLHSERALRQLVAIYQQEKDWERAIDMASQLQAESGEDMRVPIAHFFCELAELARAKNHSERLQAMLKKALETDIRCVRATILQGKLEAQRGNHRSAVRIFKRVERQDAVYMTAVLDPLKASYRELEASDELVAYMEDVVGHLPSVSAMLILADLIREREGDRAAASLLAVHLRRHPSIEGTERLVSLYAATSDADARRDLEMLVDLLQKLVENRLAYRCTRCGFAGRELHWQCPSCKSWSTVKPLEAMTNP